MDCCVELEEVGTGWGCVCGGGGGADWVGGCWREGAEVELEVAMELEGRAPGAEEEEEDDDEEDEAEEADGGVWGVRDEEPDPEDE